MGYLEFYGLSQEPFSNTPVGHFYFDSKQHSQALVRLMHIAERMKGLALCVGDIGTGKTTLARRMLENLVEEHYEAALLVIIHSAISANWLLKRIALQLGVENPANEKLHLLSQLYRRLIKIKEEGRRAVVLIDEAQMLQTKEIMEEFRGLLNLEVPEQKLITFVFFGLPEIDRNLRLDPPLLQRVALRCELSSLDLPMAEQYIRHRLKLAGAQGDLFLAEAFPIIHRICRGVPRLINTLCDNALFEGFIAETRQIDGKMIGEVGRSLGLVDREEDELLSRLVPQESIAEPLARLSRELAPPAPPAGGNGGGAAAAGAPAPAPSAEPAEGAFEAVQRPGDEDIDRILSGIEEKS